MELPPWSELPALAICNVYQRLSLGDVLNASSTCVGWRVALALYNGDSDDLPLHTSEEDANRNLFLISLFGVKAKSLTIILNSNLPFDYVKFSYEIWPRVCDLRNISRLTFVATQPYLEYERDFEGDLLKRLFLWPLLVECSKKLHDIAFKGCGNIADKFLQNFLKMNDNIQSLEVTSLVKEMPSDITSGIIFQDITALSIDYDCLKGESLQAILDLKSLEKLALHVHRPFCEDLRSCWTTSKMPKVYLHCVRTRPETLADVRNRLLCDNLNLEAIRVLFCDTFDGELMRSLSRYTASLKEVTWIDVPITNTPIANSTLSSCRKRRRSCYHMYNEFIPNPIIMVAWRCMNLEKITFQGYYHSCIDLLGISRLRGNCLKVLNFPHLTAAEDHRYICHEPEAFQRAVRYSPDIYVTDEDLESIGKCLINIPDWPVNTGTDIMFDMNSTEESDILDFIVNYPSF